MKLQVLLESLLNKVAGLEACKQPVALCIALMHRPENLDQIQTTEEIKKSNTFKEEGLSEDSFPAEI